jgi:uncharacterized protein YegP (UPF0339 family)
MGIPTVRFSPKSTPSIRFGDSEEFKLTQYTAVATAVFVVYQARDGFRWRLVAANGEIVGSGEAYSTRSNCERAVQTIQRLAPTARISHQ